MDNLVETIDYLLLERLIERDYIKWMIDELDQENLSLLLLGIGIESRINNVKKINKQFLRNKLLLKPARIKLRDKKLRIPIIFEIKEEDLTIEKINEITEELSCSNSIKALIFFMQNFYEESISIYDTREVKVEVEVEEEVGVEEDTKNIKILENTEDKKIIGETELKPKVEKRLQQKILNLDNENKKLQLHIQKITDETKEKISKRQSEINDIKHQLAEEKKKVVDAKKINDELERENKKLLVLMEKKLNEVIKKEPNTPKIPSKNKKRIAMLGNPKNNKVLNMDEFDIDIYEASTIENFKEKVNNYHFIFLLQYRFDENIIDLTIPKSIANRIKRIENFQQLTKKLEALPRD